MAPFPAGREAGFQTQTGVTWSMAPTLLVLMSDTGGGHRAAAEAIAEATARLEPSWDVVIVDFIRECAFFPFDHIGRLYRPTVDYTPWLWAAGFYTTAFRPVTGWVHRLVYLVTARGFRRLFRRVRPDLVVSVHPFATEVAARVLFQTRPGTPFAVVVTDLLTVHPLWFTPQADLYLVPNAQVGRLAERAGIAPDYVRVTGLPVSLRFSASLPPQTELKKRYGLPSDRPLVLLMGGGEGMGPLDKQAQAVAGSGLPLSLMVIAGRNERLRQRLAQRAWPIPTVVTGFVNDMPYRMAAADVIVTKAGPGTLCEALTAARPLLITRYIPGQEAGNVRWIVGEGAGLYTPGPAEIRTALQRLFSPDGRPTPLYREMADRARSLARPNAALTVAAALLELVKRRRPDHISPPGPSLFSNAAGPSNAVDGANAVQKCQHVE